jgi:hypothetical protein
MASSTSNVTQILTSQGQKEVTSNRNHNAASPAMAFAIEKIIGATLYYLGGNTMIAGTPTFVNNGTLTLTLSATCYVRKLDSSGALSFVTSIPTNWPKANGGYTAVATVVMGASTYTSWTDHRVGIGVADPSSSTVILTPAYAGTLTVDLASYASYATVIVRAGTLTGNVTFNITNGTEGQIIRVRFTQDGTGSRTFTPGANLRFGTDITAITLSTGANKVDKVAFEWDGAASKADVLAITKGF